MNNRRCVFPGSFNPITKGHEDIIKRASALFDEVVILIANNPDKPQGKLFERKSIINKLYDGKIKTDVCSGLTAAYCRSNGIGFIVRGVRNLIDFTYESDLAQINKNLGIETVLLFTSHGHISSSYVRELIKYNADVSEYVSDKIIDDVKLLCSKVGE